MISALLLALALAGAAPQEHGVAGGAHHEPGVVEPAAKAPAADAEDHGPGATLMHHVVDVRYGDLVLGGLNLGPTKHLVFFVVTAVAVIGVVQLSLRGYRRGVPHGPAAAVEGLVLFIRDEIAEKNIGHDGHTFTPLLCSFFSFILVAALLGLVPVPMIENGRFSVAATTSTGNINVTMGLAIVSFLAMQYAGISKYGVIHHFAGLVPPGLPKWLLPIMIPVEILGLFTKPFALMIRLFANMLAGHMVITALLMLIPLMAGIHVAFGVIAIPISLSLALFIMLLEILVAFIQAYIFTLLTAIFIGMFAHPSH